MHFAVPLANADVSKVWLQERRIRPESLLCISLGRAIRHKIALSPQQYCMNWLASQLQNQYWIAILLMFFNIQYVAELKLSPHKAIWAKQNVSNFQHFGIIRPWKMAVYSKLIVYLKFCWDGTAATSDMKYMGLSYSHSILKIRFKNLIWFWKSATFCFNISDRMPGYFIIFWEKWNIHHLDLLTESGTRLHYDVYNLVEISVLRSMNDIAVVVANSFDSAVFCCLGSEKCIHFMFSDFRV